MIDEMTLFQVEELSSYWHKHPPVHLLVAGFVGYRSDDQSIITPPSDDYHPISTAMPPQLFGTPGFEIGELPLGMDTPVLDFEELMRQQ